MVNYSQLNNMDTGKIAKAAEAAGGVSGALSGRGGDVESAARMPADMWQGLDADSASELINRQAPALYRGSDTFRRSRGVLETLAGDLDTAKNKLADAHDLLAGTGITISADGTITTPVVDSADEAAENDRKAGQARGIIDEALRMANDADNTAFNGLKATETVVDPRAIPPAGDPRAINDWWKKLTPEQQAAYIQQFPQQIGALDGIPATDRDKANRLALQQAIDDRKRRLAEISGPGTGGPGDTNNTERKQLIKELKALERLQDRISENPPPRPGAQGEEGNRYFLLGLDPNGDGKAIVASGNPDTADNIVTYVPGMTTELGTIAGDPLKDDISRIDRMAGDANRLDPNATTAGIMWLNYDAPDWFDEAGVDSQAEDATRPLQQFQEGLRATHEGAPSNNTLLGHSYGSLVVGHASRDGGVDANQLVTVASPGTDVNHVSELGRPGDQVYSTRAENDPIGDSPDWAHGVDPSTPEFGSTIFGSAPGGETAHSEYWDDGNPARDAMGKIIIGRGGELRN